MPYFRRKPYKEMAADKAQASASKASRPAGEPPIVNLAQSVLSSESVPRPTPDGPFRCRLGLAPGQTGGLTLTYAVDDTGDEPMTLDLVATDLRGPDGAVIPADRVAVTPRRLSLAPGAATDVRVEASAPRQVASGVYAGRIDGKGAEPTSTLVEFEIVG